MRIYEHICDCGTSYASVSAEGTRAMRQCKGDGCGRYVCDRCERLGLCALCIVVKAAGICAANPDDFREAMEQCHEAGIRTDEMLRGRDLWRKRRSEQLMAVAR